MFVYFATSLYYDPTKYLIYNYARNILGVCLKTVSNVEQVGSLCTLYTMPHTIMRRQWCLFGCFRVEIQMKTHLNASPAQQSKLDVSDELHENIFIVLTCTRTSTKRTLATNRIPNDMKYYAVRCAALVSKIFGQLGDRENIFKLCRHVCSGKAEQWLHTPCCSVHCTCLWRNCSWFEHRKVVIISSHTVAFFDSVDFNIKIDPHTNQIGQQWNYAHGIRHTAHTVQFELVHFGMYFDHEIRLFCGTFLKCWLLNSIPVSNTVLFLSFWRIYVCKAHR